MMPDAGTREVWHFWHGTPELFAHMVRTAERATGAGKTVIDVCVADDHEIFDSPAEFVERVTIDALRHFESITATVTAGSDSSTITLRWRRAWWKWGEGKDAEVILEVTGTDHEDRAARIRRALLRGGTQRELVQGALAWLLAGVGGAVAAAVVVSGGYLVGVDTDETVGAALVVGALGWILGVYWGTWAYPSIEVAPAGQTNLRRLIRAVGPIVITIVLAGLTKKLFG